MKRSVLGVIPARLGSSRLPDKPLFPILGRPLIEWVWRRAEAMSVLDEVVVATDSEAVAEACRGMGAAVVMTDASHPSGTDRVAEVAASEPYSEYSIVVNVQGDEPLVREDHVSRAVALVDEGSWSIGTCASPVVGEEAFRDPSVVKVVRAADGRALYFSRAPIPYDRDRCPEPEGFVRGGGGAGPAGESAAGLASPPALRFGLAHIGLYVYTQDALRSWVRLAPSPLERLEKLEQLRPLEAGIPIGVAVVEGAEGGVDTPADVARVEEILRDTHESNHAGRALT